jgi:hypothetical protein
MATENIAKETINTCRERTKKNGNYCDEQWKF